MLIKCLLPKISRIIKDLDLLLARPPGYRPPTTSMTATPHPFGKFRSLSNPDDLAHSFLIETKRHIQFEERHEALHSIDMAIHWLGDNPYGRESPKYTKEKVQ